MISNVCFSWTDNTDLGDIEFCNTNTLYLNYFSIFIAARLRENNYYPILWMLMLNVKNLD